MKVLSIGTDRRLFEEESGVLSRSKDYASKMEELHILVFTLKKENFSEKRLGNLYLHPTNSQSQWFYVLHAFFLGNKIIKNNKFNIGRSVISTQDPFQTGFVGVLLSWKFHLPLQIQVHTDFLSSYFSEDFFNKIRRILAYFSIPKAQGVRVVSSVIADSLKFSFPKLKGEISILPVFVDIENLMKDNVEIRDTTPPVFDRTVFMASRLTEEKRIDVALAAFRKVIQKFPKTRLVISGDGPEKSNLVNLTKDSQLINNLVFTGWKNDLFSLYKTSDIFLLTSEFEGYGMTLIEAGAAGCPIVTTEVGIAKTDLFKNGINSHVCPVGDVECLSKALIDLLQNEEKHKSFSEKMRASIKSVALSKEDYVSRYVKLLEKLK